MALSMSNFVVQQQEAWKAFSEWWMLKHKEDPDAFPLYFDDDNEGLWLEQFLEFDPAYLDELKTHAPCDHEWETQNDSFSHEFGTEIIVYDRCVLCGAEKEYEPYDPHDEGGEDE